MEQDNPLGIPPQDPDPAKERESARRLKKRLTDWMQATDALHKEWMDAHRRPGFAASQVVLSALNAAEAFDDSLRMLTELVDG